MLKSAELSVYTTGKKHPAALTIDIEQTIVARFSQPKGWVERPAYGNTLGINTVSKYAADIEEMFEALQLEKDRKMSPSIMRDMLMKKHPHRYDIPSDYFIIGYLSTLLRKHKKVAEAGASVGTSGNASNSRNVMPAR